MKREGHEQSTQEGGIRYVDNTIGTLRAGAEKTQIPQLYFGICSELRVELSYEGVIYG